MRVKDAGMALDGRRGIFRSWRAENLNSVYDWIAGCERLAATVADCRFAAVII